MAAYQLNKSGAQIEKALDDATKVVANPSTTATTDLTKLTVGNTTYNISGGGSGAMGPTGPAGADGAQGPTGATGAVGPTGPAGSGGGSYLPNEPSTQGSFVLHKNDNDEYSWDYETVYTVIPNISSGEGPLNTLYVDSSGSYHVYDVLPESIEGYGGIAVWDTNNQEWIAMENVDSIIIGPAAASYISSFPSEIEDAVKSALDIPDTDGEYKLVISDGQISWVSISQ